MRSLLAKTAGIALDILFPPRCLLCGRSLANEERGAFLCAPCLTRIPLRDALSCGACGARLPDGRRGCHQETPYLLAAACSYSAEPVRRLIFELKYGRERGAARALGAIMARFLRELRLDLAQFSLIPVPLHPRRLRERGFNQAELIAEWVARTEKFPLLRNALVRRTYVMPQAECPDHGARAQNIAAAFAAPNAALVHDASILLVDDVSTSGATLREAATALKNAGAREIVGLVAARAGS